MSAPSLHRESYRLSDIALVSGPGMYGDQLWLRLCVDIDAHLPFFVYHVHMCFAV